MGADGGVGREGLGRLVMPVKRVWVGLMLTVERVWVGLMLTVERVCVAETRNKESGTRKGQGGQHEVETSGSICCRWPGRCAAAAGGPGGAQQRLGPACHVSEVLSGNNNRAAGAYFPPYESRGHGPARPGNSVFGCSTVRRTRGRPQLKLNYSRLVSVANDQAAYYSFVFFLSKKEREKKRSLLMK